VLNASIFWMRHPVEDAAIALAPRRPRLSGRTDAKQLIEHQPRVAHHRQRILG
jgi:hypothetical protein